MSRKNTILVILIVVMLGAAGYILYRGFFAGSSTPAPAIPGPSDPLSLQQTEEGLAPSPDGENVNVLTPITSVKILPLGNRFDLTLVKKYNPDLKSFAYPVVSPDEVGAGLNDLVKPTQ